MHNNMVQLMKQYLISPESRKRDRDRSAFKQPAKVEQTAFRKLVDASRVVFRFQEIPQERPQERGWAAAVRALMDKDEDGGGLGAEYWCLLGHMNHSPQALMMFSVLPVSVEVVGKGDRIFRLKLPDPVVCLRNIEYMGFWLNPKKKWTYTAYVLDASLEDYSVSGLPPDVFFAQRYMALPEKQMFWRGEVEEARMPGNLPSDNGAMARQQDLPGGGVPGVAREPDEPWGRLPLQGQRCQMLPVMIAVSLKVLRKSSRLKTNLQHESPQPQCW